MKLSPLEEERYARHFSLPGVGREGQLKLKAARVLVIGAGGLGSPISLYLAAAGIGHLGLIDPDVVSLSNLQRQILFSTQDVSLPKVTRAQAKLEALNSEIKIQIFHEKFSSSNARKLVRDFDLVIDGSDNFSTRYLVNDACVLEQKPLVFGALSRFDAQISVLNFQGGPCYRCLYPTPPPMEAVQNCSEAGVLGVLPGTVGTLMATEALKMILGIGEVLSGKMLVYDALNAQFFRPPFFKNPACAVCGAEAHLHEVEPTSLPSEAGLSWSEFENLLQRKNLPIIDVRTPQEFAELSVRGSQNIPLAELSQKKDLYFSDWKKEDSIILLCLSGKRSARAVELLKDSGLSQVLHVEGGLHGRSSDRLLS